MWKRLGRNRDVSSTWGIREAVDEERRETDIDEERIRELELFVGHTEGEHGIPRGDVLSISRHGAEAVDSGVDVPICGELLELQGEVIWTKEVRTTGRGRFSCEGADQTGHAGEHQRTVGHSIFIHGSGNLCLFEHCLSRRLVQSQIHPSSR